MKRFSYLSLAVLTLLSTVVFSSCGPEEETDGDETAFLTKPLGLDSHFTHRIAMTAGGGDIYLLAGNAGSSGIEYYVVQLDGSGKEKDRILCQPRTFDSPEENRRGEVSYADFCMDGQGNIWLLETQVIFEEPNASQADSQGLTTEYGISKLDSSGKHLLSVDLGDFVKDTEGYFVAPQMLADAESNLYLYWRDSEKTGVLVLGPEGERMSLAEGDIAYIAPSEKGGVYALMEPEAGGGGLLPGRN